MRTFQTLCVALSFVAARSQLLSNTYRTGLSYGTGSGIGYGGGISYGSGSGLSYGSGGGSIISSAPAVSYGYSSAPSVSYGYSAAPAVSVARTISAAPAISIAAAPVATRYATVSAAPAVAVAAPVATRIATVSAAPAIAVAAPVATRIATVAAAPVNVGVISAGGAPTVRSHEIHTGSGNTGIRIEDFQAGDQVIRVHEGPQAGPEIAQVQVPGEQHHIRVINHGSGRAQVERVVSRQQTQVVDVQKPGRPGARIVQVVKGQNPPPSIEFVQDGGSSHQVYYSEDAGAGGSIGGGVISGGVIGGGSLGGGALTTSVVRAAPAVSYSTSYGSGLGGGLSYGSGLGSSISYGSGLGSGVTYGSGLGSGISYGSGLGSGISYGTTYGSGSGYGLGSTTYGSGYGDSSYYSTYAKKASKKSA